MYCKSGVCTLVNGSAVQGRTHHCYMEDNCLNEEMFLFFAYVFVVVTSVLLCIGL